MKVEKPNSATLRLMFAAIKAAPDPSSEAERCIELVDYMHRHYMEKIGIILEIAGAMQQYFKERA